MLGNRLLGRPVASKFCKSGDTGGRGRGQLMLSAKPRHLVEHATRCRADRNDNQALIDFGRVLH